MNSINDEVNKLISKLENYKKESSKEHELLLQQIQKGKSLHDSLIVFLVLEKQEFLEQTKKFTSVHKSVKSMVKLNVGGTIFATTKDTLLVEHGSYFTNLLSEYFAIDTDENGCYFIDRNPKYFGIILDYLRTKVLITDVLTPQEKKMLHLEIEYYHIPSLLRPVSTYSKIKTKFKFTVLNGIGKSGPTSTETYNGTSLEGLVKLQKGIQVWEVPVTGTYRIGAAGKSRVC